MLVKGNVVYGYEKTPIREKYDFCLYIEDSIVPKDSEEMDSFIQTVITDYLQMKTYGAFKIFQLRFETAQCYMLDWKKLI